MRGGRREDGDAGSGAALDTGGSAATMRLQETTMNGAHPTRTVAAARPRHAAPRLLAALATFALVSVGVLAQERVHAPQALALLIGIDDYAPADDQPIPSLRGAVRDVALVRGLLVDRFGFAADDVAVLTDAAATHAAIVRAFHDHLIARAGPDTRVVIWFSGHGSQIPDPSGRDLAQADGDLPAHDQTLLAHDSRAGANHGSFDVTDDELHSLLAALPARDVLLVTDCCHSGGVLRGEPLATSRSVGTGLRPLDRAALAAFWPQDVPFVDDDGGPRTDRVVHIAACASDQEAGEFDGPDGCHGTLTWFLCDELARARPECSWRELVAIVRARVAGIGTRGAQHVQAAGPVQRAVLGGRGRPVPAGFAVRSDRGPEVVVEGGRIHGLGDGDALRLVDAEGREVARAAVTQVWVQRARARLDGDAAVPKAALWAVPTAGLSGRAPLTVALLSGIPADVLAEAPWAQPGIVTQVHDCVLQRAGPGYQLLAPDDALLWEGETTAGLGGALLREHAFRSLWEGIARPGALPIRLRAVPPTAAERRVGQSSLPAATLEPTDDARTRVRAPTLLPDSGGAIAVLELHNGTDEDLFVAVLSVQQNRVVNLVFGRDQNNFVRRGETVRRRVLVGPAPDWRGASPMLDRYLAISTPRWADFAPFEAAVAGAVTRGATAPALLDAVRPRTRGDAEPGDAEPWGISWHDLELLPPEPAAK